MNDDTAHMQDREPGDSPHRDPDDAPRRLTRSSNDRVLIGVSGGLGQYFGIDPLIFRISFAISIFFGGLGGLAYVLLAIFVPTDGEPDRAQRLGGSLKRMGFWRGLGIAGAVVLAGVALITLAGGAAFAVGLGWGVQVAIGVIVIGCLVTVLAMRGVTRWLVLPAVALAIGASIGAASDIDLEGGVGEREYRPLNAAALPTEGYRLGVGELQVDLRGIDWEEDPVVRLPISIGMGDLTVFVPETVCVAGSVHVGVGESQLVGDRNEGVDVENSVASTTVAVPRLEIDADADIGLVRVLNSDTASFGDSDWGGSEAADLRAAQRRACGTT